MKLLIVLALVGTVAAVAFLDTQPKGLACTLCKDFVKDLEGELENDEGSIEEVSKILFVKIYSYIFFLEG